MLWIAIATIVSLHVNSTNSALCKTTADTTAKENGTPDTPCVFPFVFQNQTWNGCKRDKEGLFWCSTKTENETHRHMTGSWGYCIPECHWSCKENQTCQRIPDCPVVHKEFKIFKALNKKNPQKPVLKKKLKSLMCHSKPIKFCCPITSVRLVNDASTKDKALQKRSYPSSCQEKPVTNFLGNMLPASGACGLSCMTEDEDVFYLRIAGGEDSKLGEFPWAALLGYLAEWKAFDAIFDDDAADIEYKCGGTLINTWYVLTAAHCHREGSVSGSVHQVVLGEWEVSESKLDNKDPDCDAGGKHCMPRVQKIFVDKVTVHDGYTKTRKGVFGDIALIRLKTEAILNAAVQMACLSVNAFTTTKKINLADFGNGLSGYDATVIGWGHTDSFDNEDIDSHNVPNAILQKGKVPLWSIEGCREKWAGGLITSDHLCAGDGIGAPNSCKGDLGGGLFVEKNMMDLQHQSVLVGIEKNESVLVGIVSYGSTVCTSGTPGVYTRVTEYIQWIQENIQP